MVYTIFLIFLEVLHWKSRGGLKVQIGIRERLRSCMQQLQSPEVTWSIPRRITIPCKHILGPRSLAPGTTVLIPSLHIHSVHGNPLAPLVQCSFFPSSGTSDERGKSRARRAREVASVVFSPQAPLRTVSPCRVVGPVAGPQKWGG